MLYLQVQDIHKSFTGQPLLDGIDFTITKGQKVALVAENGSGKSTLLKIIMGQLDIGQGEVTFHKGLRVGFLSQDRKVPAEMLVEDALFSFESKIGELLARYETLLAEDPHHPDLEEVLAQIEESGARDYSTQVKTIASQLQLTSLYGRTVGQISGGEMRRLSLARALLDHPQLLILDEPTNHLDLDMIEWLEKYLQKTQMTLLLVTHDRYFLERVCTDIYELHHGKIDMYQGNYQKFLEQKARRAEVEALQVHKMKQKYRSELERVNKMPQGRGTKSVGREGKFYELEEEYQMRKSRLRGVQAKLEIGTEERRLGSKVLKLANISKSYGEKAILERFTYNFREGERVGIVGKNGVGKSTFVRLLTGEEDIDAGSIERGLTLAIGHYEQKRTDIPADKRVLDYVREFSNAIKIGNMTFTAAQLLERFLFTPSHQWSWVSSLSWGEKRRLHLLTVLISNPNFLILDEPTNDLDLTTLGILEEFLLAYQGVLVIISHDRFFMDRLVDHIFVFTGAGQVEDFRGSYTDYRTRDKSDDKKTAKQKSPEPELEPEEESHTQSSETEPPKKLSYNEKKEFETIVAEIMALEQRKEAINTLFQTELDGMQIRELGKELHSLGLELEKKEARRFELASRA